MSKLIDKLEKIVKGDIQPFGFTTSKSASTLPQMLTIASLQLQDRPEPLPAGNIDAVLISVDDISKAMKFLEQTSKELETAIWGIAAESISKKDVKQLAKLGCDFIVLTLSSPSAVLADDSDVGKTIEITSSIEDTLIRTINMLSVDAVIIKAEEKVKVVSVEQLMMYQRLAAIVQKPILMSLPMNLAKDNLNVLQDIGINGLILEWTGTQTDRKLKELQQAIAALPKNTKKKQDKKRPNAILPSMPSASNEEDDSE